MDRARVGDPERIRLALARAMLLAERDYLGHPELAALCDEAHGLITGGTASADRPGRLPCPRPPASPGARLLSGMRTLRQSESIGRAPAAEEGPGHPTVAADGGPPLSIGLLSAGWPPDACPNGVVSYVAGMAEGLRALGHRVTILDTSNPAGDRDDGTCGIGPAIAGRGLSRRAVDWLWYRVAPRTLID